MKIRPFYKMQVYLQKKKHFSELHQKKASLPKERQHIIIDKNALFLFNIACLWFLISN